FYIGKYEVTFAEYDVFAEATSRGKPDDNWGRGDHPVINVSWYDAMAYANWLSKQTEKKYSLPTEAQWEYAARAGETEPFFTGNCITTAQANYNGNHDCDNRGAKTGEYRGKTVPVDTLLANLWGLHHMAGNVWEWTCSEYSDQYGEHESVCIDDPNSDAKLVVRGGSWKDSLFWARSAKRARNTPNSQHSAQGFRLVRSK
ncbi:MAG: SUMF1/EgtB/PvdO family nonheme iron enzyme, partial [Candidatus Competibacteraceae bacterium]|nr:SUMF1/EgtB/PvdO family nonheme iron enzyme [Candidatus Competibacteraceae bacterium]